MELSHFVRIMRRQWILIASTTLLGLLMAGALSLLMEPVYKSHTQLFVAIQSSGTVSELQQGNNFSQARVQSYVKTATTPVVLQPAIDSLGLDTTPADLASNVEASAALNTVLITISASDRSPVQAAALADAVASSLITAVEDLESSADVPSPVRLSVITPAVAPTEPASPDVVRNIGLGFLLGGLAGIALAVLRAKFDTKIRGEEDVRRISQSSILGAVVFEEDAVKKPLISQIPSQSSRAESFRQIRTNLQFTNLQTAGKTILITSSLPGEGKTTTATNLAIALAQAGQRVLLIDADLRRPMIATYLGLEGGAGLTTALVGAAEVEDLLQPWGDDQLFVLTSGQLPPNPSELLGSPAMTDLLEDLEGLFDVVVIDAPPLIPVTDSSVLSQKAGGVLLVVGTGKIRSQDLEKSIVSLKLVEANVLGAVLNFLPGKGPDAYTYSSYSYEAISEQPRTSRKNRTSTRISATSRKRSRDSSVDFETTFN